MPNKWQIVQGALLVFAVIHDMSTQIKAEKAAQLYVEGHQAHEAIVAAQNAQIQYLCHMLDKHDIPTDEFDLIALNYNQ